MSSTAAHPRSRGEHCPALARALETCWLIPARAGNTLLPRQTREPNSAHPRSRGEHNRGSGSWWSTVGSSPLARGTPSGGCMESIGFRLIPARAGNTIRGLHGKHRLPAHPRSRGEHPHDFSSSSFFLGSSPLARGTHANVHPAQPPTRLIPARAGNTGGETPPCTAHPAHPRSRGEHAPSYGDGDFINGSSPLARGTPLLDTGEKGRTRLIPARAGNTRAD